MSARRRSSCAATRRLRCAASRRRGSSRNVSSARKKSTSAKKPSATPWLKRPAPAKQRWKKNSNVNVPSTTRCVIANAAAVVVVAVTMGRPRVPGGPALEEHGKTGRTGSWKTGDHVAAAAHRLPAGLPPMKAVPGGVAVVLRQGVLLRIAVGHLPAEEDLDHLTADHDVLLLPAEEMMAEHGGVGPLGLLLLSAAGRQTAATVVLVAVGPQTVDHDEHLLPVEETMVAPGDEALPSRTDPRRVVVDLAVVTLLREVVVDLAAVTPLREVVEDLAAVTLLREVVEDLAAGTLLRVVVAVTPRHVAVLDAATRRPEVRLAVTTVPTGGPVPAVMTRPPAVLMTEHRLPAKPNPKMAGGRSTNVNPIQHAAILGRVQS